MDPQQLMDVACPPINDLGWAYYFAPATVARGEELGVDLATFYALGRGGVLGDVEAPVVTAAFGYFNPAFLEPVWERGRAVLAPREAAAEYWRCAAAHGRDKLTGVEGLDAFNDAAEAIDAAADPVGLALYSGARLMPLDADAAARAMQLVAILRELRGSAHLLALRAVGLEARRAHLVKRPNDGALFGWSDDDAPKLDDDDRARHAAAEALTDELVRPAYAALDTAQQDALVHGLAGIAAALTS